MKDTEPVTGPADGSTTGIELVYDDTPAPPGRPVRLEPTPPGFWRLVLGTVVGLLAPFFGILTGSTLGKADAASGMGPVMGPLYWGFFIGGLIGALGLAVAGFGLAALMRHSRSKNREKDR